MKTAIILIGIVGLALADNAKLPVLYQTSLPNSNVVVFRGANVALARAAGLLPGGPVLSRQGKTSPPVVAPAPYVEPAPAPTPAPYVAPTTLPPPPPTTTAAPAPPPTTAAPTPAPTPAYRPAPLVYHPAPVAYRPAPVAYRPAPVVYKPAPVVYKPAPVVYHKPAPAYPAPKPAYPAHPAPVYPDVDPQYTWEYNVDDAHYSHFGHKESRDHYLATGVYYVNLPDGRTQTVTYTADENGYVPIVTYSGEAKYPDAPAPYAPAY